MFTTMAEIRSANRRSGQHWFDASTMAFFESRVEAGPFGGRFFVSSEQFVPSRGPAAPRLFTVREVEPDGSVETFGGFQAHESESDAIGAILEALSLESVAV